MLPFLPRTVAKALSTQKNAGSTSSSATPSSNHVLATVTQGPPTLSTTVSQQPESGPARRDTTSRSWKGKATDVVKASGILSDEEYAALFCLAMSEHALWSDPDLRRTLEHSDEGFIPLTYVTTSSPYFCSHPSEAILVKALRAHAENTIDIRLLMSSPSRAEWHGKDSSSKQPGGCYEIRLKDWRETLHRSRNFSRNEWELRTVYLENIPQQQRSIAGIYRLVNALLPSAPHTQSRVQSISLPKHHLDKAGDVPKCKGFALITLLQAEDVDHLVQRWPWKGERTIYDISPNSYVNEVTKCGLRILPKARWDQLNAEYLQYRQRLLDENAVHQGTQTAPPPSSSAILVEPTKTTIDKRYEQPVPPILDLSAPYPPGCLAHVRHVHPETNKTTLRKLFAKAFPEGNDGIDYVDFNKGMDTCYLRLATPKHADKLVKYFSVSFVVQANGLDDVGSSQPGEGRAVTIEMVDGTREELYWLKVPEKLRRQAVEKAVLGEQSQNSATHGQSQKRKTLEGVQTHDDRDTRRRRKR
ncbi:hypothetical protein BC835DRAFT_1362779 [Cytidiella melzeri]|nr:hypothetical protein BC835DRAFT_1362779 [Cytidiella melzeri]